MLAGNGIRALLCERAEPTPVISFGIIDRKAAGGITITASHNPAAYNGFKVRSDYGGAIDPEVISELEGRIDAAMALGPSSVSRVAKDEALERGLIEPFDPATRYVDHIRDLIDWQPIKDAGLKVVHDAMYGAGIGWFEGLLVGGKTKVIQIEGVRNPWFGGLAPEPIPRNLQALFDTVRREGAAVGLATDGDSDRLGVCDEHGNIVDQLRAYSLIALYLLEVRGFRGPIVKALNSSSMLDRLGQIYDVPVIETAVGFKYVAPAMMESNAMVGGEESGGYAFRNHIPERDGIVAGLFLLDFIVKTGEDAFAAGPVPVRQGRPALLRPAGPRLRGIGARRDHGSTARCPPDEAGGRERRGREHDGRLQVHAGRRLLAAGSLQWHRADHADLHRDDESGPGPTDS